MLPHHIWIIFKPAITYIISKCIPPPPGFDLHSPRCCTNKRVIEMLERILVYSECQSFRVGVTRHRRSQSSCRSLSFQPNMRAAVLNSVLNMVFHRMYAWKQPHCQHPSLLNDKKPMIVHIKATKKRRLATVLNCQSRNWPRFLTRRIMFSLPIRVFYCRGS